MLAEAERGPFLYVHRLLPDGTRLTLLRNGGVLRLTMLRQDRYPDEDAAAACAAAFGIPNAAATGRRSWVAGTTWRRRLYGLDWRWEGASEAEGVSEGARVA
jgi:hypothetical protein